MKTWYRSKNLTMKIALLFISLNFLIVGLLTVGLHYHFQRITRQSVEDALGSAIMANNNRIQEILKRMEISLDLVHDSELIYGDNDPALSGIAEMIISFQEMEHNRHLPGFREAYESNVKLFKNYFKTCFGETGNEYSNILFVDTDWPIAGYLKKVSGCVGYQGLSSALKVEETDWYQQAKRLRGEPYWFTEGGYLCMAKALEYHYMLSPVSVQDYELGVIVTGFPISLLSEQLHMNELTFDSEVFLIDGASSVVYSTDENEMGAANQQLLRETEEGKMQEIVYEGRKCLVNQTSLPLELWILTVVPMRDVYRIASQTIRIIGVAGVFMVALSVVLTVILSMAVVTPLKEFSDYMEAGNTDIFPFDIDRQDEIGILYKSFDHLLTQLKDTMYRELTAQKSRMRAEFCALQMQINPHYIYNTLNSISCLAMLRGQEDIADLIGSLTKVIRYNINDPTALVPLSEELDTIRQYENIQKSCYQNRILFEYDIEAGTENFMIPKLMVQPLMENAVFHGMDPDEKILRVLLKIGMEEGYLVITVRDNGKKADIDKINLCVMGRVESKSSGLGIHNIYERLQIVYGENSTLSYRKDERGNTVAAIRIPCVVEAEEKN